MRIATFNVQNLRLRRLGAELCLDGARDADDEARETGLIAAALDVADRELTAGLIAAAQADMVALQEVYDQDTLDHFHDVYLAPRGAIYPYRVCLEGNDGRSADVAILSRCALHSVQSHAELSYAQVGASPPLGAPASARVFRRDCLAVHSEHIRLFICHLKASAADDAVSRAVRKAEARAVRHVIEHSIADAHAASWLALGDFNAHDDAGVEDLATLTPGLAVDLCARLPRHERWTYHQRETDAYSCPDRILASPALAAAHPRARPQVLRMGMSRSATAYKGPRFDAVGAQRPHASDHAMLLLEFDS